MRVPSFGRRGFGLRFRTTNARARLRERGCPWDERTCAWATFQGRLETLKWARERGCPWDEETCSHAAKRGDLEVLKWAHANGSPSSFYTRMEVVVNGHRFQREVVQWLKEIVIGGE
jgi:hypothetical protein